MNVAVTCEHRFLRSPNGAIWTGGINSYEFWTRYQAAFDQVKVVARVHDVDSVDAGYRRADGPGVRFFPIPNYLGPWQYAARRHAVRRAMQRSVDPAEAVIMRVSSHLGGCLEPILLRSGHPFGLEVVNDPYDVFAPGAVRYRLRPVFRWWFTRQLGRQCRAAAAVAYVTEKALQARYPSTGYSVGMSDVELASDTLLPVPAVFTTHYSSVELTGQEAFAAPRRPLDARRTFHLVTVASLAQMYKAPDILIRAVRNCVQAGFDLNLRIVGDGKHRTEMERLAVELGLSGRIQFLGQLPAGASVRAELDRADLFVLPSRCEGLPRAMVEAMARALPCIGSTVGGIPELLHPDDLIPPGEVGALERKIREVLSSPDRMTAMSARNLERAQDYRDDVLAARRKAFFEHVRAVTAEWLEIVGEKYHADGSRTQPDSIADAPHGTV